MIPEQKIEMHWTTANKKYFVSKGYIFTKLRESFYVSVFDLQNNSTKKIDVICDKCGKTYQVIWYNITRRKGIHGEHLCINCKNKYSKEYWQKNYHVNSPMQLKSVQEKMHQTNLKKYGCKNVFENKNIREKINQTNLKKYGNVCSLQNEKIKEKAKRTIIKKYGVEYPSQNKEIQNRILLNRAKALNGNTVNVITSKQQLELCKYLHGEINKSCDRYNIDIVVKDIAIEYDGKGHRLRENFSHISEENFNKQEEKRDNIIMSNGYKIIRISNLKDIKINFKVLAKYLRLCKNIVKRTNMHKVQIDVRDMSIHYQNKVIYGGKYNNGG